jgi:hypothetical protein
MRAPTKIPDFHMTHVQNHIEMAILLLPFLGIRSVALPKRKLTVRGRPLFPAKNESTTAHTEHKRQAQRPRTSNNPKAEGRSPQVSTSQLSSTQGTGTSSHKPANVVNHTITHGLNPGTTEAGTNNQLEQAHRRGPHATQCPHSFSSL